MVRRNNLALVCVLTVVMIGAPKVSRSEPSNAEIDAFVAADENKDQHLSMLEFKRFLRLMATAGDPKARLIRYLHAYRFAFGVVDQDRDGLASPAELMEADAEN